MINLIGKLIVRFSDKNTISLNDMMKFVGTSNSSNGGAQTSATHEVSSCSVGSIAIKKEPPSSDSGMTMSLD